MSQPVNSRHNFFFCLGEILVHNILNASEINVIQQRLVRKFKNLHYTKEVRLLVPQSITNILLVDNFGASLFVYTLCQHDYIHQNHQFELHKF